MIQALTLRDCQVLVDEATRGVDLVRKHGNFYTSNDRAKAWLNECTRLLADDGLLMEDRIALRESIDPLQSFFERSTTVGSDRYLECVMKAQAALTTIRDKYLFREPVPALEAQRLPHYIQQAVCVLESDRDAFSGTAFSLGATLFATCSHCLAEDLVLFRDDGRANRYPARCLIRGDYDLAVLHVPELELPGLPLANSPEPLPDHLEGLGYPDYARGTTLHAIPLTVTGAREFEGRQVVTVTGGITVGMSGGPVISPELKVVGIMQRGKPDATQESIILSHHLLRLVHQVLKPST